MLLLRSLDRNVPEIKRCPLRVMMANFQVMPGAARLRACFPPFRTPFLSPSLWRYFAYVPKRHPIVLANGIVEPHYTKVSHIKTIKIMRLFAALRKIREFERAQLPFLESIVDFDIVIEIGYAEEEQHPLTLKTLLLLNLSSRTTVRRRLADLIEQGIVRSRRNANDQRSSLLTISSSNLKLLERYAGALTSICASIK